MVQIVLGVIGGFVAWAIVWFGSETVLSAIWPAFGAHQAAFQEKIELGPLVSEFYPDSDILVIHIVLASIVSVIAGFLASLIARETKRAPLILGLLLLSFGLLKAVMSWEYVPVWYHVVFTAILLPMTILGGKFKAAT